MTPAERRTKARRMYRRGKGKSIRAIAGELGVSPGTVHRWVNPTAAKRYRESSRAWKAEHRPVEF